MRKFSAGQYREVPSADHATASPGEPYHFESHVFNVFLIKIKGSPVSYAFGHLTEKHAAVVAVLLLGSTFLHAIHHVSNKL